MVSFFSVIRPFRNFGLFLYSETRHHGIYFLWLQRNYSKIRFATLYMAQVSWLWPNASNIYNYKLLLLIAFFIFLYILYLIDQFRCCRLTEEMWSLSRISAVTYKVDGAWGTLTRRAVVQGRSSTRTLRNCYLFSRTTKEWMFSPR